MRPQEQESEEEFLHRFEKLVNEIPDEEFFAAVLSEQTEDENLPVQRKKTEQLYLSKEAEKYVVNFIRRRIMQVLSIITRKIILTTSVASSGALPAIALPLLKAFGYGPRKLWKLTSTEGIDNIIKKVVQQNMSTTADVLYPGDTNLRKIAKASFQEIVRAYKRSGAEAKKKIQALPEPEKKEIDQQLAQLKQQLTSRAGPPPIPADARRATPPPIPAAARKK